MKSYAPRISVLLLEGEAGVSSRICDLDLCVRRLRRGEAALQLEPGPSQSSREGVLRIPGRPREDLDGGSDGGRGPEKAREASRGRRSPSSSDIRRE